MSKTQCEGWRRKGGMFTFGPVHWRQCENEAKFILTVKQDGKKQKPMPACTVCLKECEATKGIDVLKAEPITK